MEVRRQKGVKPARFVAGAVVVTAIVVAAVAAVGIDVSALRDFERDVTMLRQPYTEGNRYFDGGDALRFLRSDHGLFRVLGLWGQTHMPNASRLTGIEDVRLSGPTFASAAATRGSLPFSPICRSLHERRGSKSAGTRDGFGRARIDGKPAEVLPVNVLSRGVVVPPGAHRVEMRYMPAVFIAAIAISAATLLGMALLLLRKAPLYS